jgi:mitochondrial intermediate peptidase
VLKWGAGRDPWDCVAGVLGRDDLKGGGKEAMEQVGQWGIERP